MRSLYAMILPRFRQLVRLPDSTVQAMGPTNPNQQIACHTPIGPHTSNPASTDSLWHSPVLLSHVGDGHVDRRVRAPYHVSRVGDLVRILARERVEGPECAEATGHAQQVELRCMDLFILYCTRLDYTILDETILYDAIL